MDSSAAREDAWQRHMRAGAWDAAWQISDAVLRARAGARDWHAPRHLQAIWDGAPLAGRRVLVRCYHGLGDTLQFIRFVPAVSAIAARVLVWVQPALIPLLSGVPDLGQLLPLHDGEPDAEFDVDVEIMELAHVFRITPERLGAPVPYLRAELPSRDHDPAAPISVGMVWRSGDWDPRRSVPAELLRPLAAIPGVSLRLLQRGQGLVEAPPWLGTPSGSDDVLDAARAMQAMDLVITVDSMPAHLAGALGLPVWTLLPAPADWRWMEGRDDTPWYPTMRLFRQPAPGDWRAVMAQVAAALQALAKAGANQSSPGAARRR